MIIEKKSKGFAWIMILGGILLIGGIFLSISYGAKALSLGEIVSIFLGQGEEEGRIILLEGRLPRAIGAALVGGFLGVAGGVMQGVTRNPIAEPSIMGVTQGATLMIAITFVLQKIMPEIIITGFARMCFAFVGASISGIFVYFISSRQMKKADPVKLVLAGTAIGTLLISLAMGISMYHNLSQQLSFWITGGFIGVTWEGVTLLLLVGGLALLGTLVLSPKITILSLGEEVAVGLGENTNKVRLIALFLVILLTGVSVSVGGNIVFVGLIVPQIVKGILGADYRYILPASMVVGGILMVYSDTLSRWVNPPYETPVGSITALLGVPVFIYLVRKGGK